MTLPRPLLALVLALAACKAPPPAPEGLDASARYMIRNFYAEDPVFGAGVQGYLDWFENGGGKELLGVAPTVDDVETSFTVTALEPEDVAALPLDDEIVQDPGRTAGPEDDTLGPRDLSKAVGVIAVDEIGCDWWEVEAILLGPDAAETFGAYESYERTYLTSEDAFFEASRTGVFSPIDTPLTPHDDGFDPTPIEDTLLLTDNVPDPAPELLVGNLPPFDLRIEARHGVFEVEDQPTGLSAILSYAPAATWEEGGQDGIRQTFAMEMLAELGPSRTLRMIAIWNEPEILGVDPSTPLALVTAVSQARKSSEDLKDACAALQGD